MLLDERLIPGFKGGLLPGLGAGVGVLLDRPISALTLALGGSVLLLRFLRESAAQATEEGERQIGALVSSIGWAASTVVPWGRSG